MRCRKCGEKAVINMRQHRLSLCSDHFLDWLPEQTERVINKYQMFSKQNRILVAVSGGKDSLALWDILYRLGYVTEGVYIDLGIEEGIGYSDKSRKRSQEFAEYRDLNLHVVNVELEYGKSIPEFVKNNNRGKDKPCSVCGVIKRHIMNEYAEKNGFYVLVTAHNLDDEAAILLSNTLNWSLEYLARGGPVLKAGAGFARKTKPFFRIYERESASYAFLRDIQFVIEECPFSIDSKQLFFKKHLNEWEEKMPGTKLRFYGNYLKALTDGAFRDKLQNLEEMVVNQCTNCGQPTTSSGQCSFCRLFS